jgi:hypothetical protein
MKNHASLESEKTADFESAESFSRVRKTTISALLPSRGLSSLDTAVASRDYNDR